jgi:hypothetical protein
MGRQNNDRGMNKYEERARKGKREGSNNTKGAKERGETISRSIFMSYQQATGRRTELQVSWRRLDPPFLFRQAVRVLAAPPHNPLRCGRCGGARSGRQICRHGPVHADNAATTVPCRVSLS